jgi:hypothetical protein
MLLKIENYEACTAADGEDAVEQTREFEPELRLGTRVGSRADAKCRHGRPSDQTREPRNAAEPVELNRSALSSRKFVRRLGVLD